jgi:hypothetical protein
VKKISKENVEMLEALCMVVSQYMPNGEGKLPSGEQKRYEHRNMTAGEYACDVLEKHGLAEDDGHSIVVNQKFHDIQDEFSDFRRLIDNKKEDKCHS